VRADGHQYGTDPIGNRIVGQQQDRSINT